MFKNYIIIAWRNLFRHKGFAFTNLLGLTIGITCTMLILLWVKDELTYDKFHTNYTNIYQVIAHRDFKNQVFTDYNMAFPLNKAIQDGIPQVKNAVVSSHRGTYVLSYGNKKLKKEGYTVGGNYFDMFSWKFAKGKAATALTDPYSIVITTSTARALFDKDNPIGKLIKVENGDNFKVTAVVEDVPGNSSLQFDFVKPYNYSDEGVKRSMNEWSSSSWDVYVQTIPGADIKVIDKRINEIKHDHDKNDKISTYFSFPMNRWRLYSEFKDGKNTGGMISYVKLFSLIALIILLIACVNFMNLSTARSERRAREVGIRKTLGSQKRQIILQFFLESTILAFIALVFSIITLFLLLPSFNILVDKQLRVPITQPVFWLSALAIVIITGVVAGSYPALYLSSFNPVKVLKGTFLAGKWAVIPRRVLVVAQFIISILLISGTIIVYTQIQHVKNRSMGYDPNNLVIIPSSPETDKNYAVIKQELLKSGMIGAITRTGTDITQIQWRSGVPDWEGKPADVAMIIGGLTTDVDFSKTMGVKILEGKDFSGMPSDSTSMLLNKAAVEVMGLKKPVGMQMKYGRTYTVIGVTDNVVSESPYQPVNPMLMLYDGNQSGAVHIRLGKGVSPQVGLKPIEEVFKKYNPSYPFEYKFVDQEFGKKFLTEELISKITNLFAGLAIFICCLGLAGLASFTIEKRFREIGIRKVLGASMQQVLALISAEFVKLVLIAFVIAVPLAWWAMHNWLQKYTYHININIWMFAAVGVLVLFLTLLVVSLNAMRAALANPVKSLRSE